MGRGHPVDRQPTRTDNLETDKRMKNNITRSLRDQRSMRLTAHLRPAAHVHVTDKQRDT